VSSCPVLSCWLGLSRDSYTQLVSSLQGKWTWLGRGQGY